MKKYTFIAIVDDKAIFSDNKNYYVDELFNRELLVPGVFTYNSEALNVITEPSNIGICKQIKQINNNMQRFAVIEYKTKEKLFIAQGISTGVVEDEQFAGQIFQVEDIDITLINDNIFLEINGVGGVTNVC